MMFAKYKPLYLGGVFCGHTAYLTVLAKEVTNI